jgi:tRNA (guanosine-2'-O-)-methyltransferase
MKPLIGTDLKRFLRDYKRANPATREIAILLQSVEYPANVGSIMRMAEGAGVNELVMTGITPTPPHPTIDKVARYKGGRLNWRYEKEPLAAIKQLRQAEYQIVAVELATEAQPYFEYEYADKVCLVLGHEDHGVTKSTLAACDGAVFLPMYGKGRSLNVHVAASIVTYHVLHSAK